MSDHSLASSVETDEILRLADGVSSQGSGSSKGNMSDHIEELEQLIEKGDWTGVVNAAAGMTSEGSKRKLSEVVSEQNKPADTGATDQAPPAADWAQGQSLLALVQAEKENPSSGDGK